MARETAAGEKVKVAGRPAKFVDAGAHGHGAVDAAAGDDDIRAFRQCPGDRESTEIGICAGDPFLVRKGRAGEHVKFFYSKRQCLSAHRGADTFIASVDIM